MENQPGPAAPRSQERQLFYVEVVEKWPSDLDASGRTLGRVLGAGEWRSAASFAIFDETSADNLQLLRSALDESDDE